MKSFYCKTLILLILFAIPKLLIAATPHDMIAQEFFKHEQVGEKGSCTYCHLAFRDPGNKVWKKPPESLKGFGRIGPFCYSCHDGITIVDINVDASRTAFSPKSHGMNLEKLPKGDSIQDVNLKYVKDGTMECTTCHDPHKNENRPFLNLPLKDICNTCHQTRRNSGFGKTNAESNHPVSVSPTDSTGGTSPISLENIFKTAFPKPYPIAGGKFAEGVHWDLGGHLTLGNQGNMECYTCHAVHGDEIKGPNDKLMAVDPKREINDAFCESCHIGVRGDGLLSDTFPNPGGTIFPRTYHPADDDISNGSGRIVEIEEPDGWPFGSKDKNILCSTCHDAHNAMPYSPILRDIDGDTFCEECHDEIPEGHHPSGEGTNPNDFVFATTEYMWTYENEAQWENGNPEIKLEPNSESNGYGTTYGNNVENKIYCSSCHRAHNAGNGVEKKADPSLVISHTASQLCFLCHPKENITFNLSVEMISSHFLGDPTLEETFNKTEDEASYNEEEWPETKIKSKYGGDNEREIICESCHSFSKDNLNADKYGYSNNSAMLVARSDENIHWIVENEKHVQESEDPDDAIEKNAYLCVGCHGETPGGGGSHPMMNIDGVMPIGTTLDRNENVYPLSYTKSLNMNCNSCHYVHEAKMQGGVYILKETNGENLDPFAIHPTQIDYTILCSYCHKEQSGRK